MKQQETARILAAIKTAYPNFVITREAVQMWQRCLNDIEYADAEVHLYEHIRSNRFPPTIADIVGQGENEQFGPVVPNAVETRKMFEKWDQHKALSAPSPRLLGGERLT